MHRTAGSHACPTGLPLPAWCKPLLTCALLLGLAPAWGQGINGATETGTTTLATSGAILLRDTASGEDNLGTAQTRLLSATDGTLMVPQRTAKRVVPYVPSEFERYVQKLAGETPGTPSTSPQTAAPNPASGLTTRPREAEIRRFGADLIERAAEETEDGAHSTLVPPDYLVQPGDELALTVWGTVNGDLRLKVDRTGRISVPRVGSVMVAGVRYADLTETISKRVALVFKNFQLSVSLSKLRGMRVFVTGFAAQPGLVTVSSLSTLSQALLRAGGPSAAGSFRDIQLRRGRDTIARFDLYKLLLEGDRTADQLLQADDVIHVGPIGPQVALIGSVNRPAVFELRPGETATDVLRMAGGFAPVADTSRLSIERLDERATVRVNQITLPGDGGSALKSGDVLRAFNAVSLASPIQRQNKRVRVEGEVTRPGEYLMPPDSTLSDALARAGGLTPAAYVFGTEFTRESVRATQQENYDRALRDLETDMARTSSSSRISNSEEAAGQSARSQASARLIERLRAIRPTGRVVLQLPTEGGQLPDLALEDGDRLLIPPRPSAVGVFGSVFNAGNYLYAGGRAVEDYLRLAGGPTRGADRNSTYVVRANGSVVSGLQGGGWFSTRNALSSLNAEPGDTIFVPEEQDKTTFIQNAKDWTQILYQFGLGIAGIKAAIQ